MGTRLSSLSYFGDSNYRWRIPGPSPGLAFQTIRDNQWTLSLPQSPAPCTKVHRSPCSLLPHLVSEGQNPEACEGPTHPRASQWSGASILVGTPVCGSLRCRTAPRDMDTVFLVCPKAESQRTSISWYLRRHQDRAELGLSSCLPTRCLLLVLGLLLHGEGEGVSSCG